MMTTAPLLSVDKLSVVYRARGFRANSTTAVDGVSFELHAGETVGVVGESGSGKSTIGRAILGLVQPTAGSIHISGQDVTHRTSAQQRAVSKSTQVVFQDPYSSLNPGRSVGRTLTEPLEVSGELSRQDAQAVVANLLNAVQLPADAANRYPHNFSGGQRQRIAIARSLSTDPELVICDEAVSALDLVTRAQVLNLLMDLQRQRHLSFLFIAHDLPIVTFLSHRVVVLYRGRVMEQGPAKLIESDPLHPYTATLLAAAPVANPIEQHARTAKRVAITKAVSGQQLTEISTGCPFAPRCLSAAAVCWSTRPTDLIVAERTVACHMYDVSSGHPDQRGSTALPDPEVHADVC